jgi:hypothetical protein
LVCNAGQSGLSSLFGFVENKITCQRQKMTTRPYLVNGLEIDQITLFGYRVQPKGIKFGPKDNVNGNVIYGDKFPEEIRVCGEIFSLEEENEDGYGCLTGVYYRNSLPEAK